MKFFNWMQHRFNGGQAAGSKTNRIPPPTDNNRERQEFNDWPADSLLAIGTLGNTNPMKNTEKLPERNEIIEEEEEECSSPDLAEFTTEEFWKLQKALGKLLSKKSVEVEEDMDLPLDRFFNCPSNLDFDRTLSNTSSANSSSTNYECDEDEIDRTIRAIIRRCRDVCENKKQKTIGKKSVSFLFKKIFACTTGFAPAPSLRDTFQESRMDKLLRTMLSKKINRQNSSRVPSKRRYLEDKRKSRVQEEEEDEEEENKTQGEMQHSGKWDKTNSEYIVLEI
ncbi:unnamed protein product [Cuscuta europaea]|uniref:Uncharacterized protein n=1 Tax=Cuscuta europaea TaxID=41803 RepID=A0A9P1A010_CUSEU|nr:unnamed protein product [Cuscuta europaea]